MNECPKCDFTSGDDWSQCQGSCPMKESPHYKKPVNFWWEGGDFLIEHEGGMVIRYTDVHVTKMTFGAGA